MKNTVFVILVVSLFYSCNNSNSEIVGSWKIKSFEVNGESKIQEIQERMFFRSDGDFIVDHGRGKVEKGKWKLFGKDSIKILLNKEIEKYGEKQGLFGAYSFVGNNLKMDLVKRKALNTEQRINYTFELEK